MATRTFTLAEAQRLLPILESLLKTAITSKQLIEQVDSELQELGHRIFLNGGTLVNVLEVARRKSEREKAVQRAKDAVAEIHGDLLGRVGDPSKLSRARVAGHPVKPPEITRE